MKLTKSKLKRIIKEEINKVLKEGEPGDLEQRILDYLVRKLTPRERPARKRKHRPDRPETKNIHRPVGTLSNLAEIFIDAMNAVGKNISEIDIHDTVEALKNEHGIGDSHAGFYPEVTIDKLIPYLQDAAEKLAELARGLEGQAK